MIMMKDPLMRGHAGRRTFAMVGLLGLVALVAVFAIDRYAPTSDPQESVAPTALSNHEDFPTVEWEKREALRERDYEAPADAGEGVAEERREALRELQT